MRDTLAALIERVEKATGPDRCIDAGVFAALHPELRRLPREPNAFIGPDEWIKTPPFYTASLDAAVSLVPTKPVPNLRPGQWWWMLEVWPDEVKASVHYENGDSGIIEESATAATPALALVAAALRARMESER